MKRQLITLDFETYFSSTLGFASHTTQEYVMHPDFEVIMVGITVDDDEPQWFPKEQVAEALALIDWDNVDLLCQNTNFDGSILAWHYGHVPARYMDTMAMAACTGVARLARGASLAAQAKFMQEQGYDIPSKGNETVNAKGLLRNQFSHAQLQSYANYCMDDVRITRALWRIYQEYITEGELDWHDMVIRMFTLPQFQLDKVTIKQELERVVTRRKIVQHETMRQLHLTDDKAFLSVIMSNPKFASALENFGCIPPKKISKRTGKETFAFARTDEGMLGLLEHTNENVRALAEARLGLKSSIEVTRCEKFLKLAELGAFAMPYRVSGAASHRLGGSDGINLQNLPSGRKEGQSNALRRAITAPAGYTTVVGDSGQIEVRVLAYVAGQQDLLDLFAQGRDPYTDLAAVLYHRDYDELLTLVDAHDETAKLQRQTGKVGVLSLGYGAGAKSTQAIASIQYGIELSDDEVQHLVDVYRSKNHRVPRMWNIVEAALNRMVAGYNGTMLGNDDQMYFYDGNYTVAGARLPAIRLPDGMWITFPNLRSEITVKQNRSFTSLIYDDVKGKAVVPTSVWGGSATGILIQATAFALMKYQGLQMSKLGLRPALNTHDEFAIIVPEGYTNTAEDLMVRCMTSLPPWMQGLPIKCSHDSAQRYGDAK